MGKQGGLDKQSDTASVGGNQVDTLSPKKYVQKLIAIEALKFGDNVPEQTAAARWVKENGGELHLYDGFVENGEFAHGYKWRWSSGKLETQKVSEWVDIGDYIIKDENGRLFTCKSDVFAANYESEEL